MADRTTLGIEIDGTRITVVEASKGVAVASYSITGTSTEDALVQALAKAKKQKRGDDAVRISLATPGTSMRRIDVTAQLQSRANFEDAVYAALPVPREGSTTAGLFFNPDQLIGGNLSAGVAVVAPEDPVLAAYQAMDKVRSEVVAPPLAMTGADGLWLAVCYQTADLTLVTNGHPVAYRQMTAGGLSTVIGKLGEGASDRIRAVLDGSGTSDLLAQAEVDTYVRTLADEVRTTSEFWTRNGETIPAEICVHGPGSTTGIVRELTNRGFTPGMPDWLSKRLTYLPIQERDEAVGAFLAAMTVGTGLPQSPFVNPDAAALAAELARRDQRAKYTLVGLGVLTLVAVLGLGPLVSAVVDVRAARQGLDQAKDKLAGYTKEDAQVRDVEAREAQIKEINGLNTPWADAFTEVWASAPDGISVSQATATAVGDDAVQLQLSVQGRGGYLPITKWLRVLVDRYGESNVWMSTFADTLGRTNYQISVTYKQPSDTAGESVATTTTIAVPASSPPSSTPTPISTPEASK